MGFFDYITLQINACCVISDSGTSTEEASILNFTTVIIRKDHERQEGMDERIVIISGIEREKVMEAANLVINHHKRNPKYIIIINDYNLENVSI